MARRAVSLAKHRSRCIRCAPEVRSTDYRRGRNRQGVYCEPMSFCRAAYALKKENEPS